MNRRKVVGYQYFPSRPPLALTALWWLVLDRFGVSGAWWGVFWTIIALFWISFFVGFATEETADPFKQTGK